MARGADDFEGATAPARPVDEVSDLARDRALQALRERYALGGLTLEQFSSRLDAVFAAASERELVDAAGGPTETVADAAAGGLALFESLRAQLAHGERVLWIGQPDTRSAPVLRRVVLPLGLVMALPALIWVNSAIRLASERGGPPTPAMAPVFGALAVMVLVLFVLVVVMSRLAFNGGRRRTVLYAVTDRRVLRVVHHRQGEDVTAVELSAIPAVSMRTRRSGGGTIVFGNGSQMPAVQALELGGLGGIGPMAFVGIADAGQVAELIRDLREGERRRGQ
jgi:uncharacterized membrane protein